MIQLGSACHYVPTWIRAVKMAAQEEDDNGAAKRSRAERTFTSGAFDQTYSKKVVDEAGEPTADAGIYGSGIRQTNFQASFDFASVTPATEQPGLLVPDLRATFKALR